MYTSEGARVELGSCLFNLPMAAIVSPFYIELKERERERGKEAK